MSEHDEQVAVFQWAAISEYKNIFQGSLFAIPNQGGSGWNGKRRGMQMVKEGLKKGTADIFFAYPIREKGYGVMPIIVYHGLFIEMKAPDEYLKPKQREFLIEMMGRGYAAQCCQGAGVAVDLLTTYMTAAWKIHEKVGTAVTRLKLLYWKESNVI